MAYDDDLQQNLAFRGRSRIELVVLENGPLLDSFPFEEDLAELVLPGEVVGNTKLIYLSFSLYGMIITA